MATNARRRGPGDKDSPGAQCLPCRSGSSSSPVAAPDHALRFSSFGLRLRVRPREHIRNRSIRVSVPWPRPSGNDRRAGGIWPPGLGFDSRLLLSDKSFSVPAFYLVFMGTTESRHFRESCNAQIHKLETISNICCRDDSIEMRQQYQSRLLVSAVKTKRGKNESKPKSGKVTDPFYCCESTRKEFASDHGLLSGPEIYEKQSVKSLKNRGGSEPTNTFWPLNSRQDTTNFSPRGAPPGWSEKKYVQLKKAIEDACLAQKVKHPRYSQIQVYTPIEPFPSPRNEEDRIVHLISEQTPLNLHLFDFTGRLRHPMQTRRERALRACARRRPSAAPAPAPTRWSCCQGRRRPARTATPFGPAWRRGCRGGRRRTASTASSTRTSPPSPATRPRGPLRTRSRRGGRPHKVTRKAQKAARMRKIDT